MEVPFKEISKLKPIPCNTPGTYKFKGEIDGISYLFIHVFGTGKAKMFQLKPNGDSNGEAILLVKKKKPTSFNFYFPFKHPNGITYYLFIQKESYNEVKVRQLVKKEVKVTPIAKYRVSKDESDVASKLDAITSILQDIKDKL